MYNRYIPGTNGIYERQSIPEPVRSAPTPEPQLCQTGELPKEPERIKPCSTGPDLGDLLLLCIILLLMVDSEQEDLTSILITAAAFLFLQ